MRFNDAIVGAVFMLLAGVMIAITFTFPPFPGQKYGPSLFPRILGGGIILCSALLILRGWKARRDSGEPWLELADWIRRAAARRLLRADAGGDGVLPAGLRAARLHPDRLPDPARAVPVVRRAAGDGRHRRGRHDHRGAVLLRQSDARAPAARHPRQRALRRPR